MWILQKYVNFTFQILRWTYPWLNYTLHLESTFMFKWAVSQILMHLVRIWYSLESNLQKRFAEVGTASPNNKRDLWASIESTCWFSKLLGSGHFLQASNIVCSLYRKDDVLFSDICSLSTLVKHMYISTKAFIHKSSEGKSFHLSCSLWSLAAGSCEIKGLLSALMATVLSSSSLIFAFHSWSSPCDDETSKGCDHGFWNHSGFKRLETWVWKNLTLVGGKGVTKFQALLADKSGGSTTDMRSDGCVSLLDVSRTIARKIRSEKCKKSSLKNQFWNAPKVLNSMKSKSSKKSQKWAFYEENGTFEFLCFWAFQCNFLCLVLSPDSDGMETIYPMGGIYSAPKSLNNVKCEFQCHFHGNGNWIYAWLPDLAKKRKMLRLPTY